MDDDVKSTQRSDNDPKEAPPPPATLPTDVARTPKSVPTTTPPVPTSRPATSLGTSKKGGEMKTAACLSSPRSTPMNNREVKSMPAF
uniref:Uncharacterized protein n=1 Tax=Caenorhabditis tropicalis TaxID=1561998 RepID=A0A1I7UUZ9_9PELO